MGKERRKRPTQRVKPKQLAQRVEDLATRLEEFITGHNKLSALVNQVVVPNIQELAKLANSVTSLNQIIANHAITIYIIKKKLSITDEEFQEAKTYLYDRTQKNPQPSGVQPAEAGPDEDRGSDGQAELLDAESGGSDDVGGGSVPVRKHAGGSGAASQDAGPGDSTPGSGEDETIVLEKAACMGPSELQGRNIIMKASQMGMTKAHEEQVEAMSKGEIPLPNYDTYEE